MDNRCKSGLDTMTVKQTLTGVNGHYHWFIKKKLTGGSYAVPILMVKR